MVCVCSMYMFRQCPLAHRTIECILHTIMLRGVDLMGLGAPWLDSLNVQPFMIEYIAFLECVSVLGMFRRCHLALAHLRSPKMKLFVLMQPKRFLHLVIV